MAKLVLDHVAGFCQPWRKTVFLTCPWAEKGEKKKGGKKIWSLKRKHSTARRRISNLPFTELYSRHNEAVTHRPPAQLCLPASANRHTNTGAGAAATTSTSTAKEKETNHGDQPPLLIQRAASPLRPRGTEACNPPLLRATKSSLHGKKRRKNRSVSRFALWVDESFCPHEADCVFGAHPSDHLQEL